nr:hypothetical protein BaRGS_029725 [Batillaria attramentaria]
MRVIPSPSIEQFVAQLLPVYEHAAAGAITTDCESLCKKAMIAKKGNGLGTTLMASLTCPVTCKAAISRIENMLHGGTTTKAPSS